MLENHIPEIDQDAFLTVFDAREVLGNGFKSPKESLSMPRVLKML
jgi:hypothetical protein